MVPDAALLFVKETSQSTSPRPAEFGRHPPHARDTSISLAVSVAGEAELPHALRIIGRAIAMDETVFLVLLIIC